MKYALLAAAAVVLVPLTCSLAVSGARARGWLLALLILTIGTVAMNKFGRVTFVSMQDYRGLDRGFPVTLCDLIAIGLGLGMALRLPHRLAWLPRGSLPMVCYFLIACAATTQASVPLYSAFALFKLAKAFLLFWVICNAARTCASVDDVWKGYAALGMFLFLYGCLEKIRFPGTALQGPFDHQNQFCLFLDQLIPVLLMWGLAERRPSRMLITLVAALGCCVCEVATSSRAGIAILAFNVVACLVVANLLAPRPRIRAVSLLVFAFMALGALKAAPHIIERIETAPVESLLTREEFNHAARLMADRYPLGVGPNNWSYVLTNTSDDYGLEMALVENDDQVGVCHNNYLLTAAEMGWSGLLLLLVVLVRFLDITLRGALRASDPSRLILFGFLLGALAVDAQNLLEPSFFTAPVLSLFLANAAVCVAWTEPVRRRVVVPALQPVLVKEVSLENRVCQ
ncbi:MAG: O-antigen ligase family protein [Candidatus Xenobia bacterium]